MAIRVKVRTAAGQVQSLSLDVATEHEAVRRVAAAGGRVLAVESEVLSAPRARRNQELVLLLFTQELLALLGAGLNLTEAMTTLVAKEQRAGARATLSAVLQSLREGRNISDALELHPDSFPEMFVATVRSAERTGGLVEALSRYIAYSLQFDAIRKKLVAASIYPLVLLVVGGLVTLFLLGYVVPKFSVVYGASHEDLPWLSGLLLSFGMMLHEYWQWGLLLLLTLMAGLVALLRQPMIRQRLLDLVLQAPGLAERVREFRLARFYRGASLLLHAGIPLPKALRMVSGLLSLEQRRGVEQACRKIEEGQRLSTALVAFGLAGVVAESLIQVGERSGRLADMLEQAARFQDEDFSRWLEVASRLIEPLLMTIIGIVVGGVVVLLYMPIFELAGSLG
ncbi:MAG: ral secretion pathway protein GspF [Moraxellaceae bacterium]|jgi:general secretion pathway protein F|nr:ral secretion pathway protein GspF [Moraxellaceae bacterium]